MSDALESVYREHHARRRGDSFITLEDQRAAYLQNHIGTGKTVLDVGCRDGALTSRYAEGNTVTGLDIDSVALLEAKKHGINTVHADLNGPWPVNGNYDVVVACEIIEHLYYPDQVLKKVYEQLTPGGMLVGSIPHAFSLQSRVRLMFASKKHTALQDPTHINHFWGPEFKRLVEGAGFVDVELTGIVAKKFQLLSLLFPYTFAHSFMFSARKPEEARA